MVATLRLHRSALRLLTLTLLVLALPSPQDDASAAPPSPAAGSPVILELFTSQGCSGCPAADRLLTRLAADPALAGRVVPLAFHVDYWNHLGWSDPFSARRWSERQNRYAHAFDSQRIYTPQLVVGGTSELNGSDEAKVRRAIETALAEPPAGEVTVREAKLAGGAVRVAVEARLSRAVPRGLDLVVALTESGLSTPVGRGENAKRTLDNDFVVRRLERAATLAAKPAPPRRAEVTLPVEPGWQPERLRIVAFLQDPKTLAIHGAAPGTEVE